MNLVAELRRRFRSALTDLVADPGPLLAMVLPAQDTRFGDYQANCAMPLARHLGRPPREVAQEIAVRLRVDDLCQAPDIAGPGFLNLRLRDDFLAWQLNAMRTDARLAVEPVDAPRRIVLDYSSPNVAKPMHVGHIRSTVIGDSLYRVLRFVGHDVISDNHVGDWGTQFGMIIYGYKHFLNADHYRQEPVAELARLYKLVHRLVEYWEAHDDLPRLEEQLAARRRELAESRESGGAAATADQKKAARAARKLAESEGEAESELQAARARIAAVDHDPQLAAWAREHREIGAKVLQETASLHAGDSENRRLWHEFLPACRRDMQRIYDRLGVRFDVEHGESFYQDRLSRVVADLKARELATISGGAACVFLPDFDTPMIVQKKDGAFLYATTDLATIQYRWERWQPAALLYVVDHRQKEHFDKLFATARLWGYADLELEHIRFGTVLGEDGRPFKTRSGTLVGLEDLLDEAVQKAYGVVCRNDDEKSEPELSEGERRRIAEVVGLGAIKYADLSVNRESDYVFSYDKMMALEGNTATYMQYSYARTQSIFAKGDVDVFQLRQAGPPVQLRHPAERALALALLRFPEALQEVADDYRPNHLTSYLFELSKCFSTFFTECPVLRAETPDARHSRLTLCDLTGRIIRQGLELLGIQVVDKM